MNRFCVCACAQQIDHFRCFCCCCCYICVIRFNWLRNWARLRLHWARHIKTIYPDIHTSKDWLSWQLFDVSRTEWATVLIKNHKFKHWYLDLCARFSRLSIDPSIDCQSVRIIDLMNANGPKCRLPMYMLNIVWIFFSVVIFPAP